MEHSLDKTMDEIMQSPGVKGVMFTDKQGLCLGAKGQGSQFNSGGVSCIAKVAAKLDSDNKIPQLILLEGNNRQCLIQQKGEITGAIYKLNSAPTSPNM